MKVRNIPAYCCLAIEKINRKYFINPRLQSRLKNRDFSIIASTCNGGVLTSDLGVRFNSPFVNLWMYPEDFLRVIRNLEFYMNCELNECKGEPVNYPVGILNNDAKIYFLHYHSFEEAKEKWNVRRERINYNNLYFMFTDKDGCTESQIREFDSLPYDKKIVFTAKQYKDVRSAIWCKEFSGDAEVPVLTLYRNLFGERLYDRYFDFVQWLNE